MMLQGCDWKVRKARMDEEKEDEDEEDEEEEAWHATRQ